MLLTVEIILVIVLAALLIYFKKEQTKTLIRKITIYVKKITSYELFPKIFWGIILGVGILCFDWLGRYSFYDFRIINYIKFFHTTVHIQDLHLRGIDLAGPLFGIFIGIVVGASSKPFSFKKLFLCIIASFIGGLIMSKKVYLSETTSVPQILDLLIVYLIFTPIAIGIGDGSLFKILIGYIGGIVNYCIAVVLVILGGVLGGGHLWFGGSPFTAYLFADIAFVFGTVLILLGIGFSEVMDITKFKEIFKGINK